MALKDLKPINHYSIENPPTIFDEEALTALELTSRSAAKINEIIEWMKKAHENQNMTVNEALIEILENIDEATERVIYELAEKGQLDMLLRTNYEAIRKNILPVSNVREFGAVGDGVADDSEAILAAFANSSEVYFPEGTYKITETININSYAHFYGAGVGKTILKYEGNDYLFKVSARFGNRPIIEGMNFEGLSTNGLLNCDAGAWGATVAMRDFNAYQFKTVMRFASAFACLIENALIMTYGKIVFDTYDGTATETNFSNCNLFRNVYIAAYSTGRNLCHFEMLNVRDLTFDKCQLERVETLMKCTNKCRMIKFNECWFEDVGVIYDVDSSCLAPVTNNCNFVEVTKRNAKARYLDYLEGTPTIKEISGSTSTQKGMLDESINLAGTAIENPTDGFSDWMWAWLITTKAADFRMPINTRVESAMNVGQLTQDLNEILRYSSVNCTFRCIVHIRYSSMDYRMFKVDVYRRGSSWIVVDEEIKDETWAGSAGANAETTITCTNGVLKVASSIMMSECEISTEFNIKPNPYSLL